MYDLIQTFCEIYNIGAAFVIVFMIGQILIMLKNIDKSILKARLFLNSVILERTWMYISIAAASFAIHSITNFMENFYGYTTYYLNEITQVLFLVSFVLAVYQWYSFLGSFEKSID
jgi:hypothetical protein